ncbi:uncharacterized protein LOC143303447 [Bombus vancouverensis nearcticus]|uniref:uncharacterized protein LOC143303447 n=1 Tax=Bombus vancouverensis nearcticus TaxID=2705178 RepID=UPI00402B32DA
MYVHIIYAKPPRVGTKPANTFVPMADWSTWSKHTRAAGWHNFALLLNLPLNERPKPVIPGVLFHLLCAQFRKKLHASHLGHVSRPSKEEIVWMRSGTYNGDSWKRAKAHPQPDIMNPQEKETRKVEANFIAIGGMNTNLETRRQMKIRSTYHKIGKIVWSARKGTRQ